MCHWYVGVPLYDSTVTHTVKTLCPVLLWSYGQLGFIGRICYSRNATQIGFVYIPGVSTINRQPNLQNQMCKNSNSLPGCCL